MMFNARFVLFTLLGQGIGWITQRRDAGEDGTDWREAILTHWQQTVFGTVWGVSTFILWPMFFWWLSPVIVGLRALDPALDFAEQGELRTKCPLARPLPHAGRDAAQLRIAPPRAEPRGVLQTPTSDRNPAQAITPCCRRCSILTSMPCTWRCCASAVRRGGAGVVHATARTAAPRRPDQA